MRVVYRQRRTTVAALDGIDAVLPTGTFTALIGPSGCGKSTLLRTIGGLQQPTAGSVTIGGEPPRAVRRATASASHFRTHALLPWLSACRKYPSASGDRRGEDARPGDRCLVALVGIAGFADARPPQLSGGMRQRVAIARALVARARRAAARRAFRCARRDHAPAPQPRAAARLAKRNQTTLLVTHSIEEAVFLADRVIVLSPRPGRVVADRAIAFARPRDRALLTSSGFHELVDDLTAELDAP